MKYRFARLAILAVMMVLSACHPLKTMRNIGGSCHDPKPYQKARSVAPLKIPPGFDSPDTASALHVPTLNQPAPAARKGDDPCLDEPPPFVIPKKAPPQA